MKLAKNMTESERQAALDEIKQRRPELAPMDTTKKAAEMNESQRREWLAEHKRRFGL
jgi:hypothetical protein